MVRIRTLQLVLDDHKTFAIAYLSLSKNVDAIAGNLLLCTHERKWIFEPSRALHDAQPPGEPRGKVSRLVPEVGSYLFDGAEPLSTSLVGSLRFGSVNYRWL